MLSCKAAECYIKKCQVMSESRANIPDIRTVGISDVSRRSSSFEVSYVLVVVWWFGKEIAMVVTMNLTVKKSICVLVQKTYDKIWLDAVEQATEQLKTY